MLFEVWWKGLVFGIFTTTGMLAFCYALMVMWKKYEDKPGNTGNSHGCDAHAHH